MKYFFVSVLMLLGNTAFASSLDAWACPPARVDAPDVETCGVAVSTTEEGARSAAFEAAKKEFTQIYEMDDSLRGHAVTVKPLRVDCFQVDAEHYKCKRGMLYTLQHEMRDPTHPVTVNNKFESYTYDEASPRLHKGMKKTELLQAFGRPDRIKSAGQGAQEYSYHGTLCEEKSTAGFFVPCSVFIDEDGLVESWTRVDNQYTADLK